MSKSGVKKKASLWSRMWKQKYLQMLALPGVIFMIIFNFLPLYGVTIAFKQYRVTTTIGDAKWVGLKHFQELFATEDFWNIIINTLGISILNLLIAFPIAILFAIMLNELASKKLQKAVQTISYLPHFLSWTILGGLMITWLGESGLINEILVKIGILDQGVTWLGEPDKFWGLTVISHIWKETGWSAIIYLAAIAGIDQELYEAAKVDGVNQFQKIRYITLPCIAGTIAIMFILAVSGLLNANFDQILILKNPLNAVRAEVFDTYVYRMGIGAGRFSYATAAGLFKSVVSMILLVTANKVSKKATGNSLY